MQVSLGLEILRSMTQHVFLHDNRTFYSVTQKASADVSRSNFTVVLNDTHTTDQSVNFTATQEAFTYADATVFFVFETFGCVGFVCNMLLAVVILRFDHIQKPSFILILSLAIADVLHTIVTSAYFYPPIITKHNIYPYEICRAFNALDWTAWSITLTHMAIICIDRALAISTGARYSQIVTVPRVLWITLFCWFTATIFNAVAAILNVCCAVIPWPEYYTFGFEEPEDNNLSNVTHTWNLYKQIYIPVEVITMIVLAFGNSVTLWQLYTTCKRKMSLKRASAILLDMSQAITHRKQNFPLIENVRELRVFAQIVTVTLIFFAYMFNYYLFFYFIGFAEKWASMFNSLFYSITHMINPIIYFSLNEQLRNNVKTLLLSVWNLNKICFSCWCLENEEHRPLLMDKLNNSKLSNCNTTPATTEGTDRLWCLTTFDTGSPVADQASACKRMYEFNSNLSSGHINMALQVRSPSRSGSSATSCSKSSSIDGSFSSATSDEKNIWEYCANENDIFL